MSQSRKLPFVTVLLLGVPLMFAFQNCGQGMAFRSAASSFSGNGTGYDGKPYARMGSCAGQDNVISSKVWISTDRKSGQWEYVDCFKDESDLDMATVTFHSDTSEIIVVNGTEYVSLEQMGLPPDAVPPASDSPASYKTVVSCVDLESSNTTLEILKELPSGKLYSRFLSPKTGSQNLVRIYDLERSLPTGCPFGNYNSDILDLNLPYHLTDLCLRSSPSSEDAMEVKYRSEFFLATYTHRMSCLLQP
jgi:hypothetical protein